MPDWLEVIAGWRFVEIQVCEHPMTGTDPYRSPLRTLSVDAARELGSKLLAAADETEGDET